MRCLGLGTGASRAREPDRTGTLGRQFVPQMRPDEALLVAPITRTAPSVHPICVTEVLNLTLTFVF